MERVGRRGGGGGEEEGRREGKYRVHSYTIASHIYAPIAYKPPPPHFQSKFFHKYFYLTNRPPPTMAMLPNNVIFRRDSYTVKFKVFVVEQQSSSSPLSHCIPL